MRTDTRRGRAAALLDLRRLSHRRASPVAWQADAAALGDLARRLGLLSAVSVELRGEIRPEGDDGFRLEARLRARVVQSCVVTLAPVPAAIESGVLRRYLAGLPVPGGGEHESPEDDSVEPLPDWIDLAEIAGEALSLALPDYPRAPAAVTAAADDPADGEAAALSGALPGAAPAGRANRPFAGLAGRIAAPGSPRGETGEG